MPISYEYVGKTGGAKLETIPVSQSGMVGSGVIHEIFTLDVPAGVEYMILVAGTMTYDGADVGSTPILSIGGKSSGMTGTVPEALSVGSLAGPGNVTASVQTRAGRTDSHFSGTVYWVILPAR